MKKICKNCEYWTDNEPFIGGDCSNPKFVYTGDGKAIDSDGLGFSDHEGYAADFETGPDFGCVHFKAKTK